MLYVGMLVIIVIGTFLHFLYAMSGKNKFVAIFAAVNESVWEHIKIAITPTLLWGLFEGYKHEISGNFLVGEALGILVIIILIPVLFYSYSIFTKKSILPVDIVCFCITIICSRLVFNYYINMEYIPFVYVYLCSILLFIQICAYMFLTFNPLKNIIFEDPITHKYGLEGHPGRHHHDHKH